jgi:hypothetical protein
MVVEMDRPADGAGRFSRRIESTRATLTLNLALNLNPDRSEAAPDPIRKAARASTVTQKGPSAFLFDPVSIR